MSGQTQHTDEFLRQTDKLPRVHRERIRLSVLLPLALGLLILTAAAVAVREDEYQSYLHSEAVERTDVTRAVVEEKFQTNSNLMQGLLSGIAQNPAYIKAFEAHDRDKLLAAAKPEFEKLRQSFHISHFYFHDLNHRVFLRMHKPDAFGDEIKRRTLVDAATSGTTTSGFERGPFAALAQRVVMPWQVNGQRIGYLELTMDLDKTFADIRQRLDADLFAIVNKDQIDSDAWHNELLSRRRESDWGEFKDVVVMDRASDSPPAAVVDYINNPPQGDSYTLLSLPDDRTLVAQTIGISDLGGNHLAHLAVFSDVSDVSVDHRRSLLYIFLACASASAVLLSLFHFYFGKIERRLVAKRMQLEEGNRALSREVNERMRVEQALKSERAHLEENVQERTKELSDANRSLEAEVNARAKAEAELDQVFTLTPDVIALGGFDGYFKRANPALLQLTGYSEEEILTVPFDKFADPEQMPKIHRDMAKLAKGEPIQNFYLRLRHKDGHWVDTEWNSVPIPERDMFLAVGRDISQRIETERRLSDTNATLRGEIEERARMQGELDQLFTSSLDLLAIGRFDGTIARVNPSYCTALGYTEEELVDRKFSTLVLPEDLEQIGGELARVSKGETLNAAMLRTRTKDGRIRYTEWNLVPIPGRKLFYATGRDVTEVKELEDSLRATAAKLHDAQRIGKVGSWEADMITGESVWSDETFRIYGLEPGEVEPTMEFFFSMVHPDDRERLRTLDGQPPRDGEHRQAEHRIVLADGSVRELLVNLEFACAEDGTPLKMFGTCQDITERKEAERAHIQLEEQLRVSQKMDAIGALAGGVAHDFNNLLSVILTYVGFVQDGLDEDDPSREDLDEVEKAAQRAAALTRQLLAFGRKQIFQPVPLDINEVVNGLGKMLGRLIGENIQVTRNFADDLGLTLADPGQIEQVLMNLVINARDAMPDGGRLVIETANIEVNEEMTAQCNELHAGPYVMLRVSDTGSGMDEETRRRVFEPFFTTKEVGKGTGLGLPTVYGIVKQSKGAICVKSTPGEGSVFSVFLPRDLSLQAESARTPTEVVPATGDETILVVEDEEAVRHSAARILRDAGYEVLTAENGFDALEVCEQSHEDIKLVLTDVVMPEMGGVDLAEHLVERWPAIRVLFMSGYTGDALAHHGMLDAGVHLVGKPFNAAELTRKIREVLDAETLEHASGAGERSMS